MTDVWVDGKQVVDGGEVRTIDITATGAKLNELQQVTIAGVRQRDWANRSIDEMAPMVLASAAE